MNENEVKKLYTALINKGFSANDIGDENTFVAKMGDQNARKQFYDAISKTSFKIGDYDTFEKRLTSSAQVEQPTSTLKSTELFNVIPVKDSTAERDETYSITNPSQSASAEQPYAEHRVPTYGEGEYATGFGQGFKQGWKGLKEGVKYFVGETANLISGSSQDDAGALKRFDELQQSGQELQQPLLSRKDRRYHKQMSGAESVTVPMEFQYDEKGMPIPGTGRVLTEEEKQKHRDILQNDEYNQLISDAITAAGGDLSQARRILAARAEDKTWGDRLMESASEEMAKIKLTKGMGAWVGNLIPQMIPAASSMMLSVVTKNPKYLKYIGGLGMGTMSVSTAGQSMKEARDAGADNAQVWAVGLTNAAIEYATEKIPFDRYTTRLFNGTKKNVAQELSEAVADNTSPARAELEKLLIAANKKLGGRLLNGKNVKDFAGDILAEGASEFTAEALQTITPMIYENPEDYPTISEIINNGWEGAKAGLFMGSVLGGASKTLEHRQNRSRRKQQGYVDVVQVATNKDGISDIGEVIGVKDNGNLSVLIDGSVEEVAPHKVQERHKFTFDEFDKAELQMELDESHDNGYSLSTPQEMNDAQNTYDLQREKALSLFYEEVLDKIEADPIMYLDAYSGEHRDVLLDYINAKQVRDGMIQRVRDDIDSRIEESNTMVDSRTNTDTGMIQGATMKVDDRKVYVVKGNLVQYDDKSGINNSASSESVIIRDAQTGKIEIVSPDAILNIDDAIDPNEEKATAAEVIRTTYAQAEADKMEGKVAFNPGDTYTLDADNGQMQVQITANEQGIVDNGDGTINVTDGQNIFPVTKQTFQDQVDAANKARVAQYDALQQAERSMENTPEYALNDKVVLRDANGNTINGQIAEVFADDGYYIVDVDVPINGSYAARMTRDELNNMLVEHNGVNVNTPSVPAQQAQLTPVAPTPSIPSAQEVTPAVPQNTSALSRIPTDAQGNPIYEQTDADTAWDAIVEQTEGDEAMAQSVAESMLKDKQTALSKAEKMQVKGGTTIAEKIAAEKEHKAIIANAQREVELWQQIAGTVQRRQAAAEVQRKIEEEKRRIAEEAAAQQAKVEEEQPQAQTNQEELAVEDSEQEVADVASESEEKIDDSTIGEQITEQETPVQAEEQVQSEESPAESQVTEQAETPTSAQPKESKNAKKLRKRAEKWMKDTGVTVRLLHSIDEVTNKAARAALEAGNPVSGWFSNNEVVLYIPNINSVEEIDKTFIHEVVAHKGLRMLMGEKFDALCDNVWDMMSEEDRAKYIKYPGVKGNTRKAADEYMAYLAEGVDLNKTIWQKIVDAVKEFFSSKDVTLLDEEIANLIKESYKNLKAQAETNVDNEVASIDGNDAMFSIKTYREGGRDILQKFLKGRVKAKDLTKAEAEDMLNQMDEIYAICEEYKDKYAPFGNWSEAAVVVDEDGKPVFSVIKPNGDYAMNLDFSLVCKKRRTLDAVFREMINRGIISDYDLGQVDIAKINDIIRKYGFETACRLCFVDAKRFRVAMVADAFVGIYNPLTKMTDQQLQNVSKQMGDATEGKIARMLLKNPENRIQLSRDNFMDSKGFEDIKANKVEIMSLYNAKKGTGGPKAALGDVQYLNDILKRRWSPKTAYSVGGVRLQSFSDYVPRMVFDYIQMIADLAAKKLPVHSYTKEVLFAQTFGLTGMKINLSLVPKVVEGGLAPGLDAEGNYAWQEGETFPYEEAMKLQNAEGYKENCGTIAVGVSDEHIQKLLDDENIRMVIPYHKSGLNKQVAIHNNIDQFVDYTNEQNTRNADGKKLSEEQAKKHFNFNSDLQKHGNPRKAAENYLEWCRKNNYLPKFDKFQNHPNYYKLLEDFTTCITENGVDTFVPQGAVKMNFPTNESAFGSLSELIERGLEEDAILEGMKSEKIGPIVDDIQKALDEGQTMFRVANNNQEIFVSNARKAVESIEQEKATPEQWLAMLQKNGGLKAGEDKWMGLSDWLKESKSKTLSKQDVLDFVNENAIKIEEVKYALEPIKSLRDSLANNKGEDFANEFIRSFGVEDSMLVMNDVQGSIDLYNNDNNANIQLDENGEWKTENDEDVIFEWAHNVLFNTDNNTSVSHKTRTYYVTKGLENNREIALVVPTIESWNNGDEIHFGDAGDGRAIAWIRFGQTTDEEGNHVLVIDEIQSKRHQEGRDKGYRPNTEIYLKKNGIEVKESDEFYEFYKNGELDRRFAKDILKNIKKAKDLYVSGLSQTDVPDAPFEKNWHELAFKRMLRLAAEEGFDKVAWATGEQQAQRYALSNGEGMKSFYDKMIPSFVSKYTKKWGAKVGEVTMPNLEENNTMWSVDITPEMQESVMEGQTMFRISEEQDKAYIDAVEAGDMETAQAMVDSAAQTAGYNSPRLYHGTKSEFNVFNAKHNDPGSKGFFFTDSEEMASSYGKNIKQVYLRVEDPYVIEGNGRNWNNLHTDIFSVIPEIEDQIRAHEIAMKRFLENGDIKQSQYDYFRDKYYDKADFIKDESKNSIFDIIKKYIYRWQIRNFNSKLNVDRTRDFEWLLQQLDSDVNIIFKDITDYGANITDYESIFVPHDVYVTTNPKNIKSADAVTYDDNGNVIPLSERFNENEDDVRFRTDFSNNSGYTQRDNGNRISRRAEEAESEGSFTAGTFRKMYGVSKKDFDILEELGVIKVTEWHHTGANFAKNNFYTWADSSRITENGSDYSNGEIPQGSLAEKYKENKKEIAKLAKEYEESKWEYKPKTGKYIIPTIEQYAERMANEYSFEETPYLSESETEQIAKEHQEISNSGKSSHERYTDHQSLDNKTRNEIVNRLLNNEELGLKDRYESDVRPQREHNEQVEEYNQRVNEYNSNTNGKEKALLDIANLLGFEISQDVLESKSQINRRKERLAEAREKANAKLIEKNEAISQMESDLQKWVESQKKNGKVVVRERISEKDLPENFVVEKKEMKGRYGWFDATIRYNLPVYYSGLEFSSKRLHDSYMNKRKEIRETDIRLTDEYNYFYNEVFESSQEDEGISFRIRQITDKERQTMINALSLSEGEEFYDNVFNGADQVVRENIVAIAAKNGWDFRKATEEYLGSLADNNPRFDEVKKIGLWDKVKGFFIDMLNKIGLNGFTKDSLADNDLRYILWRRFKNPKGRQDLFEKAEDIAKKYELGVGDYAVTNSNASQEEDILFRNGDPQVRERIRVRDRYERRVRSGLFQSKEAIQDSMLSLKEAMQMIAGKGKKYIEDIADYMNAYLGENRLSSVNQAEVNAFARTLFKPMLDVVARLAKTESERVKLIDYMFAKHGLERNAHMRQEALNNGDTNALNRDFAGLTALTGENNVADAEAHAQKMVDEYERTHNTAELWDKVNAISKSILSKSYECGLMSKEAYDKVSNMYQYYIPLRGFDEKTSVEEYAYLNNKKGAYNAAIRKAEGRTSKADDPFANLESMAESTIMAGNRNQLVKQKFYNFVQNNPSDLVSVSELWLEYDNVNDEWKPVFPDNVGVNDTPQQVEQKLQAFEAKMEGLKQQYPDKYKHGKDAVGIPYRVITKSDLKEHQVVVKRNGRDIILTINGNPRLAQALNGMTNPDNDLSGAIGEVLRLGERLNRILSTNYTTRNPDFIVSNFLRDMLYSNIMVWIKESPKYALKFHRNYAKLNPAYMRMLYGKYRKGTLDMNNKTEAMFYQFIMNGGETGFSNIRDMEQHKKDIAKMLKKANGKLNASQAMDLLATQFDELNRSVENCARFAAFMTSREVGRTIGRSIYDAKEISVNFNKKGSGSKFYDKEGQTKLGNVAAMTSGLGRAGFAFWNASIQGTTNFGRQLKRHPAKAFTSLATMFILGAIVAYLGNDDDEDDKNAYYNIPENVRRSNIMFRAGDSWISIPLPIEFRAMYGMGELATTILSGKEHLTGGEIAEAITAQMSQILPLDFMEGDGGLSTFVPTALKPAWEVYNNESWTGLPIFKDNDFNKNMPDWTKAYKNANKQLVNLAATLNEISGGDKYTKGAIDINPAKIEYLLNGYFGGIFSTIDKLTKTAETIAGDREYDPRSILLWNRVVKSGDERTDFRAINNEYYRVKEEVQDTKRRLNGYERDTGLGIFDYAEKIDFIYNSPEYERYEIFMDYNKDIKKLMEELKEAEDIGDKEWAKDIETELNYLKQEMLLVMEHTYDRK